MKEVDPETFGGRKEEQFDTFMFFPTLHLLEREGEALVFSYF